ncbi:zinc-binding alcohol dehydrogenase family protein [uncultured Pseudokineococcus sp.]|uniref:zinc-binding alcohol dehydrogenase family protein n=1 Tax=uncultured Pseudokineococcus sp. TaxID=1642928 RepID=UPI00260AD540|nr:zinc-binding alcohol dehydrogenase family protein [uncultured Pseudokineococcus sp.]
MSEPSASPTATVRAVATTQPLPAGDERSLVDVELPVPEPGPRDVLVRVRAVSVNPVDTKVRRSADPGGEPRVLGYDAAGVVEAVGADVERFAVGDAVWYAGALDRQGSDAELHAVDERLVGRAPRTLDDAEAAAMPLTSLTAWEVLMERARLHAGSEGVLLVVGGAGGVASMVVQMARLLTRMTVVATASREESRTWLRDLGAHVVVDRSGDVAAAVREVAPRGVDVVVSAYSEGNVELFAEVLRPFGQVVAIDDPEGLDLLPLKSKSISWHWELMFTRSLHGDDPSRQGEVLDEVARMVDEGHLRTTLAERSGPISAAALRAAHARVESGAVVGKVVVEGW